MGIQFIFSLLILNKYCQCSGHCQYSYIIIIISAERRPLLDIGLPQAPPLRPVLCFSHPTGSCGLHKVVGPPCGRPSNATSSGTRSPLQNLSAPSAICSASNVPCPLPLKFGNSSGYVGNLCSLAD